MNSVNKFNFYFLDQVKFGLEFPASGFDENSFSSWIISKGVGANYISSECGPYQIVGGFFNFGFKAYMQKTFNDLLPHYAVGIFFDFYQIDSWDSGEKLIIIVDSSIISKMHGLDFDEIYKGNFCGRHYSEMFTIIYEIIPHSSSSVVLNITTNLNDPPSDESWGVNNFQFSYFLCNPTCLTCSNSSISDCLSCYDDATKVSAGYCICNEAFYMAYYEDPCVSYPCSHCLNCIQDCKICVDGTSCNVCYGGYYLYNGICMACFFGCKFCEGHAKNCSSCNSNYFNIRNSCETSCPVVGYYGNSSDWTCKPCNSLCFSCSGPSNLECLSCFSGTILVNNQCKTCDNSCNTCKNTLNNCTSCKTGLYLHNFFCLVDCPSGYFKRMDNTCQKCDISCLECSDGGFQGCTECIDSRVFSAGRCHSCDTSCLTCEGTVGHCVSCYPGTFLSGSQCLIKCPLGELEFILENKCKLCDLSCKKCYGITAFSCLECYSGTFLKDNQCLPCENCQTCVTTAKNCLSCQNGTFFLENSCFSICPSHYWPNEITKTCDICDLNCLNCWGSNSTQCTSCINGSYIYGEECIICSNNCLTCYQTTSFCTSCSSPNFLFEGECLSMCKQGYWQNEQNRSCTLCHSSCLTCESPGTSLSCLSCADEFYLENKQCILCPVYLTACSSTSCYSCKNSYCFSINDCEACEVGYWKNSALNLCQPCDSTCLQCSESTANDCISCRSGDTLFGGTCEKCDSTCSTCSGLGDLNCLSCRELDFFEENACVSNCSGGYYPIFEPNKTCQRCSYSCENCFSNGDNQCSSCNETQFLSIVDSIHNVGVCYKTCPTPLINDKETYQCVKICQQGKFKNITLNECLSCASSCFTCYGPLNDNCLSCNDSKFLLNDSCLIECPHGYFEINSTNSCESCINNCLKCSNTIECTVCNQDFYLSISDYQCVSCIGEGIFIENQEICKNCSYGCSKCVTENNCTKCYYNFYLNETSCHEKKYVMPIIVNDNSLPFIYYLSFNDTWPSLFENLSTNKSSYVVSLKNISLKKFRCTLKAMKSPPNVWELSLNISLSITETHYLIFKLYPPDDLYFNLVTNEFVITIDNYVYCGYLKIYDNEKNSCQNLTVIEPTLSLGENQTVLLHFSADFEELFQMLSNMTTIYLENIPKSNYNSSLFLKSQLNYQIFLNFNQSLLNKPLLIVNFDLPGYLLYHKKKRLFPSSLSIIINEFYYVSPLGMDVLDFQQRLENFTSNAILPMATLYGLLTFGSMSYHGLLSIKLIKYLKYLELKYPPNALSIFIQQTTHLIPDFLDLQYEQKTDLPAKFKNYGVNSNFLINTQDEIILCLFLFTIGLVLERLMRKFKFTGKTQKIFSFLKTAFFLNATLIVFYTSVLDLFFFSCTNIFWNNTKTSKGSLNLILSILTFSIIFITFFFIYEALKAYYPFEENDSINERSVSLNNVECLPQSKLFLKASLKESKRFNVNNNVWWTLKNFNDNEESQENCEKKSKSVVFKEEIEKFEYNNHEIIDRQYKDWSSIKVLTTDIDGKSNSSKLFNFFNMLRCCTVAFIIIIFSDNAYYASCGLSGVNLIFFVYLICLRPFNSQLKFLQFVLLELCVVVANFASLTLAISEKYNDYNEEGKMPKGWVLFYANLIAVFVVLGSFFNEMIFMIVKLIPKKFSCGKKSKIVPKNRQKFFKKY